MSMGSSRCELNRTVVLNVASLAIVASSLVLRGSRLGLINWKDTAMKAI
jgi:hypothetical protein